MASNLRELLSSNTLASTFLQTCPGHHTLIRSAVKQESWSVWFIEVLLCDGHWYQQTTVHHLHQTPPWIRMSGLDPHLKKDIDTLETSVQKFALKACSKQWSAPYDVLLSSLNLPTLAARRQQIVHHVQNSSWPCRVPKPTHLIQRKSPQSKACECIHYGWTEG